VDLLIEIGRWLGLAAAGLLLLATVIVGTLSWLLNHPD
jgi:hypothetical protein